MVDLNGVIDTQELIISHFYYIIYLMHTKKHMYVYDFKFLQLFIYFESEILK